LLCALFSCVTPNEASNYDVELPKDEGYLFIHVRLEEQMSLQYLEMTNFHTGDIVNIPRKFHKSAGLYAFTVLIDIPSGHYFFSGYRFRCLNCFPILRQAPSSANDVFEIAPGVINYVGDWRSDLNYSGRTDIDISHEASTLGRLFKYYPKVAKKYEVYLSIMGRKAISIDDMAQLINKEQDPLIE
jgi:hypothetical protein